LSWNRLEDSSSPASTTEENPATDRGHVPEHMVIYPGSFDPITNGHLDLIERGVRMFDGLVVSVLTNIEKKPFFTVKERVEMLREVTREIPNVSVETFSGLLVEYAKKKKARAILRGIRAFSDYEYELQMALMNRKLEPTVETVFLMPAESYTYISSRIVKEILLHGGAVKNLVPPLVEQRMKEKMALLQRSATG
jgi:pantetheine-phosphate adenylyltransferase